MNLKPWKSQKPQHLFLFATLYLANFMVMFNMSSMPSIVVSVMEEFSLSYAAARKMLYYFLFAYGVCALAVAFVNKILRKYYTLLGAVFFLTCLNVLIFFTNNFLLLLIYRVICGFFACFIVPTSLTFIRDYFPDQKNSTVGLLFGLNSLIGFTGALLSGFISWRIYFLIPALLGVCVIFCIIKFIPKESKSPESFAFFTTMISEIKHYAELIRIGANRNVFFLIFLNCFIGAGLYSYMSKYLNNKFHIPLSFIGIILSAHVFGSIMINLFIGKLHRLWTKKTLITGGFFGIALSLILFMINKNALVFVPVVFLLGAARALIHNQLITSFLDFPEHLKFCSTSFNSFIVFIAGGLSTKVLHLLFEKAGVVLTLSGIVCILGLLFGWVLSHKFFKRPGMNGR